MSSGSSRPRSRRRLASRAGAGGAGGRPGRRPAPTRGPVTNLPLPRFVSMRAESANARRGPSLDQRVDWEFVRRGLPLEITAEYGQWRRVRDAEGDGGWVHHALLSGVRTALVRGEAPVPLRAGPRGGRRGAGDGRARGGRAARGLPRRLVRDRRRRRRGLAAARGALGRGAGRGHRVTGPATAPLRGECLCGAVAYEVDDAFEYALNCHCSRCRRATGAAFKPLAGIRRERLRLVRGADRMLQYGDAANHDVRCRGVRVLPLPPRWCARRRAIARTCLAGDAVDRPSTADAPHLRRVEGTPWFEITDGLPQFEAFD